MNSYSIKTSLLVVISIFSFQQVTNPTIKESLEHIGAAAQEGVKSAANATNNVIEAVIPKRTLTEKINDGIGQGAKFLQGHITTFGNFLSKNTPDSIKNHIGATTTWIGKNPEKTIALTCGVIATCFLIKWLCKSSHITNSLVSAEQQETDACANTIVPSNEHEKDVNEQPTAETKLVSMEDFNKASTPLEKAQIALELLSPENITSRTQQERTGLLFALGKHPVSLNHHALQQAINEFCSTVVALQITNNQSQPSSMYKKRWEKVNNLLSKAQ